MTGHSRPLDIVLPFYRRPELCEAVRRSLSSLASELIEAGCSILAINDSPDDPGLRRALESMQAALSPHVPLRVIENRSNLGFVRSANAGLEIALAAGHDALLLNSDTQIFPGAIGELQRVAAADPMIGFVSPRSNHATICSLPFQEEFHNLPPEQAHAHFLLLSRHLPDYHFVPTAVGFCLLIRWEILSEFGLLDLSYGPGYHEENDLIVRANRCGFRAALANRAFVYHLGEASFSTGAPVIREDNVRLLNERYPEYLLGLMDYTESPGFRAEQLLATLIPDNQGRRGLVFDFSSVGPYHAGTFRAAIEVMKRAVRQWRDFHVHVMVTPKAARFHRLHDIDGLTILPPDTGRLFAVAYRPAQPFELEHMARLSRTALVNLYAMLDPIALDCMYLHQPGLDAIWSDVFAYSDGVIYISDFVRDQFHRRFPRRPGLAELVSYLSLDLADYAPPASANGPGKYLLVIGNSFVHKHVRAAVQALRQAFPEEAIVALGIDDAGIPGVVAHASGHLSAAKMESLYRDARCVIYPSLYEGFGIPILEALARSRPVLARDLPVTRVMCERLHAGENLRLFHSTADLIDLLRAGPPAWHRESILRRHAPEAGWDAAVERQGEFIRGLLRDVSLDAVTLPRLAHFLRLAPVPHMRVQAEALPCPPQSRLLAAELASIRLRLVDREAQVADLRNSLSWRITAPLRAVARLFPPWKP